MLALYPQPMSYLGEQSLCLVEVFGNHRDFDDGAECEQMLLDQVLPTLAAADSKDQ